MALKAYPGGYNWEDARSRCFQDGTELAAPRSLAESSWFVDKARELGLDTIWLGVTDKDSEGTWTNQHGLPQTYFNWYPGEPNNLNNQDCAWTGGGYGYSWDDDVCSAGKHLLCTNIQGNVRAFSTL